MVLLKYIKAKIIYYGKIKDAIEIDYGKYSIERRIA